ncbi:MAG: PDZ domain-containing protein [Verrucomicrobia bacterium]|jgi:S1-C subfamily serine protease|nr:PDZ domain-containing protein [Verrucomicrobiota bacterium]
MNPLLPIVILLFFIQASVLGGTFQPRFKNQTTAPEVTSKSILRVNSTNQVYDLGSPWQKKPPTGRRGLGVLVGDGSILVTADLVANSNFIELELPANAKKSTATIQHIDYESNLALLRATDPEFLAGMIPLKLAEKISIGDSATVLQFEPNGEIARTTGRISSISIAPYPLENVGLLVFKISMPLQQRDGSFTLPAVHGGRLVGLLMRYDSRNQTADIIPMPIISRFLASTTQPDFKGFPRLGVSFAPLRDPQLRRFIGLTEPGGIYVTKVTPKSSAASAGLREGDVILAVNGLPLDQDGNYEDADYGRILFSHITGTLTPAGGKVVLKILRSGKIEEVPVAMKPLDRSSVVSPSFLSDAAPPYFILGGMVFVELSRPYLQEWGAEWTKNAPQRLVNYDAFQDELPADRGKIVVLAQILPTPDTIGYENIENVVIKELNGRPVKSIADLAEAAKHPVEGFQKIKLEEDPTWLFLDAASIEANRTQLMEHYELPATERLNPATSGQP